MSAMVKCKWCKKLFSKDDLHEIYYYDQNNKLKNVLFCKHCKDEIADFLAQAKISDIKNIIKKVNNEI